MIIISVFSSSFCCFSCASAPFSCAAVPTQCSVCATAGAVVVADVVVVAVVSAAVVVTAVVVAVAAAVVAVAVASVVAAVKVVVALIGIIAWSSFLCNSSSIFATIANATLFFTALAVCSMLRAIKCFKHFTSHSHMCLTCLVLGAFLFGFARGCVMSFLISESNFFTTLLHAPFLPSTCHFLIRLHSSCACSVAISTPMLFNRELVRAKVPSVCLVDSCHFVLSGASSRVQSGKARLASAISMFVFPHP